MQHRDDKPEIAYPDHWALPSGGAEGNETPEEAARREIREECEYIAEHAQFMFQAPQNINGREIMRSVFLIEYDESQEIKCNEGKEMKFIQPSQLSDLKVFSDHVEFIKRMEVEFLGGNQERKG